MTGDTDASVAWHDALAIATLFAIDPYGTGGVTLRAAPGPVRDRWLATVHAMLPAQTPVLRVPVHVADERLLGGLDLAATLGAGRPVVERGVLATAHNGIAVFAMAERVTPGTAARVAAAMDTAEIALERDGVAERFNARFGVIALDEGMNDDERPPASLLDRLAFHLDLADLTIRDAPDASPVSVGEIEAARARLDVVRADGAVIEALCGAAAALGIGSLRAPMLALRVARASAALAGRTTVSDDDAALAARLVLGPRATALPAPSDAPEPPAENPDADAPDSTDDQDQPTEVQPLEDRIVEAAMAALPADVLARLQIANGAPTRAGSSGRAGAMRHAAMRGRPTGVRRGAPRGGARLNILETLRAAAPWQRLRGRRTAADRSARVIVLREDFRINRFKHRSQTTTIFVVDASGSAAAHRLAEAKGAVELLLADCYVRRDQVALIAFRRQGAELLLPPTRSLVRAKRSLAGLPGGGGTPLAAGIDAAVALAEAVRRRGETPIVVLLTDGRANIARDGTPDRPRASADSLAAATSARGAALTTLVVDTSPRPEPHAGQLAAALGARYLPLPRADAHVLSTAVRSASAPAGARSS
jgi:magnesium chelatase subunit D